MAGQKKDAESGGPSDQECKQESSKAAQKAQELQKQSKDLSQAAAGAVDPEERQKLLKDSLNKQVEAESFGKVAKYLQSGTVQGLLAGSGLGVGTGATLGTITGTLVGGLTSILTGGVGGAVGTGVGALNGPFIKLGDIAGSGIQKVTGNIPGWEATEQQKGTLEKMLNGVKDTEMPNDEELGKLSSGAGVAEEGRSWASSASSYLP
ncbi:hypothetical protein BAUCODRAFT_104435, partial [Baudoinia panamericana UAMH 10762]